MSMSKTWIFIIGLLAGAVFLGDAGGNAIREMFQSARQGASSTLQGLGQVGESIDG